LKIIQSAYSVGVGDDAAKAAEIARKLKVRRTNIMTSTVCESVKAGGGLCYCGRMRASKEDAERSIYIVRDHEESLREINAISSTCNASKGN
jgi:hypothetical protein